jgi:DNA-binding NtrC family response regulator
MAANEPIQGAKILTVLPDNDVQTLHGIIRPCGARLQRADSLDEVHEFLKSDPADVVLTDCNLPDKHDWKHVLEVIECSGGVQPLIVASRLADERLWAEVLNLGGFDVLATPFEAAEVVRVIGHACRERLRITARRASPERRWRGAELIRASA